MKYRSIIVILLLLNCSKITQTKTTLETKKENPILYAVMYREGFKSETYVCPSGKKTIGYGDTHSQRSFVTEKEARVNLEKTMNKYYNVICSKYPYLSDNQCWAVVSIAINCKWETLFGKNSSFHKALKNKKCPPFEKYVFYFANGKWVKSKNLVQSRKFEKKLFLNQDITEDVIFYKKNKR